MFEDLSPQQLESEIASLAARLWAGTARFLSLVGEFDRREGWAGFNSCAQWLSWRCGLSPVTAREQVRVARALESLPSIAEAFGRGELSYSKVRALLESRLPRPRSCYSSGRGTVPRRNSNGSRVDTRGSWPYGTPP
jgi:hypothetical protein